jgi:hypothetical protein
MKLKTFAGLLFLFVGLCGCAEINVYVVDGSTATVTVEQDRTLVTTEAEIPLGTALQ